MRVRCGTAQPGCRAWPLDGPWVPVGSPWVHRALFCLCSPVSVGSSFKTYFKEKLMFFLFYCKQEGRGPRGV